MRGPDGDHRREAVVAVVGLLLAIAAWIWPIGIGGRMPVGGDVTQFSIGLMAFLHRALRAGRLPLWNDLWGFGFPGLAESQMGVFYPPHIVLYGLLPTEAAYTASLVLHTAWGGLGVYWAARRWGISPTGAALAAFSWTASGFFLIHLPHQWGYTVGSWMPWAWGLAWTLVRGDAAPKTPFLLAAVLTLQVLPGHFQLAFCTQVSLMLLVAWALAERSARSEGGARRTILVVAAIAAAFVLAAAQVWPTFRLARLATSQRDYGYLSGFAATPIHLVSYVAPGLFHRSPLWRPLAWDAFHTSPEEHLAYIGLVPLFLALGSVRYGLRGDAGVRALTVVALGTLILSLGPYVPGFALWSRLPGFSFFRAPARWGLASGLAIALLAGKGFDAWPAWPRPGRRLITFVALAILAPAIILAGVEAALASSKKPGWPAAARGFDSALRWLPWSKDRDFRDFQALATTAREPQQDLRVLRGLAREGIRWTRTLGPTFADERFRIYVHELKETWAILAAMLVLAPFATRRRLFAASLIGLTVLDLLALNRHRPIDLAPIRPLEEQSPVLARLARRPYGIRVIDASRNLPMVCGAAPVNAYRTLDLPALESVTYLAGLPPGGPERNQLIGQALRAIGAEVRVHDPFDTIQAARSPGGPPSANRTERVRDPALAGWLYDQAWVAERGGWASTFEFWRPGVRTSRAWLVPLTGGRTTEILKAWSGDPADVLRVIGDATPLATRSDVPERLDVEVDARGPGIVIVSQLAVPQWRAVWSSPGGERPATIVRVFGREGHGAWQGVTVPEPGRWTLRLSYAGTDVNQGLGVSALAWLAWGAAFARWGRRVDSNRGD